MEDAATTGRRLLSLDQFRGYTVVGMLVVNYLGGFDALPAVMKHHKTYCSYADTIMPQFFFAVGFAFRLTMLRRIARDGPKLAYRHAIGRIFGLVLIGILVYHLDGKVERWEDLKRLGVGGFLSTAFQREPFQTLVHIGLASLWVLPVITRSATARTIWLLISAFLHVYLSQRFYYEWVTLRPGIDGGPLGFLSWTIPLLAGSLAYDVMMRQGAKRTLSTLLVAGVLVMALGYGLSCVPWFLHGARPAALPFCPPVEPVNLWTMSQRSGSVSYMTFSAGFSVALYALFVGLCEIGRLRMGLFDLYGRNALLAYLLQDLAGEWLSAYLPHDAPAAFMLAGFAVYLGMMTFLVGYLERSGVRLRL